MKSPLLRLLPFFLLVFLLASCTGGDDDSSASAPVSTTTDSTPATQPDPAAAPVDPSQADPAAETVLTDPPKPVEVSPPSEPALAPVASDPAPAAAPAPSKIAVWTHDDSDIKADANVSWGVLETGLRYAILPNAEPPDRVSLRLYIDAGSLMEDDDQQGLAHFLEHMAFNGTNNFPAGEMVEYFQRLGMGFGSHNNAHTSFKETVYKIELPETKAEMLDEGFKLLRDYSDGLLFGEEEIEKERGVILSEKRDRDSPSWRSFVDWIDFALPEGRLAKRLPIGQEEVISNAPRQRFLDFYNKWYTPGRMTVVVVGDIEAENVEGYITKYFNGFDKSPAAADPDMGSIPQRGVVSHHYYDSESSETQVSVETIRPSTLGKDSQTRRTRELHNRLASAMITRRLSILAKQEGSPIKSASVHYDDLFDLGFCEYASIGASCLPENWKEALELSDQELRRALEFGFNDAELNEAKANLQNRLETQAKSAPTRKSSDLADLMVSQMTANRVFTHPDDDLARVSPLLAAATTDDCLVALREVWGDLDQVAVYASGNVEIEGGEEVVLAAYQDSLKVAVEPQEQKKLGEFAYSQPREPGEIAERNDVEDLGITQVRFANNVRANFKVTDFEENMVYVTARIGGGLLTEPKDKLGLAKFVSSTFTAGGLEAHSSDDLQQLLAGKTVGAGFGVGEDAFTISGRTTPEDLLLQLQLMRAYVLEPGYREEAARQFEKSLDQTYIQLSNSPEGVQAGVLPRLLHGEDPRFGYPAKEVLASRNLDEARAWLTPVLASDYLEIAVVGDFELPEAINAIASEFGTLPERQAEKPAYAAERKVVFPSGIDQKTFTFESEIPKAATSVYWPTTDMSDIKKTRRLGMLSSIMRDRLRKKVREELGDAYSPYARNSSSDVFTGYGYLFGYIGAAPDQAEPLADIIQQIGGDLAANGTTEDELDRAKLPMLTMIEEYRRTNGYWLQQVVGPSQEFPERLDWARSFVEDYEAISVDELNGYAKEYLEPEKALQVLILPE